MKTTLYCREDGEVKINSQKAIEKFDLEVEHNWLKHYNVQTAEENISIKGRTLIEDNRKIEIWHVFEITDYYNKGYFLINKVNYVYSEKRCFSTEEVIDTFVLI